MCCWYITLPADLVPSCSAGTVERLQCEAEGEKWSCLSVRPSVRPSVCLSVCLSVTIVGGRKREFVSAGRVGVNVCNCRVDM